VVVIKGYPGHGQVKEYERERDGKASGEEVLTPFWNY
jgi:hypothetical protein